MSETSINLKVSGNIDGGELADKINEELDKEKDDRTTEDISNDLVKLWGDKLIEELTKPSALLAIMSGLETKPPTFRQRVGRKWRGFKHYISNIWKAIRGKYDN